jgi:hypothetical protein
MPYTSLCLYLSPQAEIARPMPLASAVTRTRKPLISKSMIAPGSGLEKYQPGETARLCQVERSGRNAALPCAGEFEGEIDNGSAFFNSNDDHRSRQAGREGALAVREMKTKVSTGYERTAL